MDAFRTAMKARDLDAFAAMLTDDVVFRSPAAYKDYHGKDATLVLIRNVMDVFEGLTYERVIGEEGDRDRAYVFTATVNGREVTGCDFLRFNEEGLIEEFMVMLRPLSGLTALAEQMGSREEVRSLSATH